jgi:hypothetical protein
MAQYRYWKLKNFTVSGDYLEVGEFMLWTADTNVNSSATITAVSVNNVTKWWDGLWTSGYGANELTANLGPLELKWDFGASGPYPDIRSVKIAYYDNASRYPKSFDSFYSSNNVNWTLATQLTNIDSSGKTNYITVTEYPIDPLWYEQFYRPPQIAPPKFPIADLQRNIIYTLNL